MKINFKSLTAQVILGILLGILVGFLFPEFGSKLKVIADIFIKLVKMVIAPIIFLTIVIAAFLDIWLVRRKRRGFPEPSITMRW